MWQLAPHAFALRQNMPEMHQTTLPVLDTVWLGQRRTDVRIGSEPSLKLAYEIGEAELPRPALPLRR